MAVIEVSVSNFVAIQSGTGNTPKGQSVATQITPTDVVTLASKIVDLSSTVRVSDAVGFSYGIKVIGVAHSITLSQATHPRTHIQFVVSNVGVNGQLIQTKHYAPTSQVTITQIAIGEVSRGAKSILTITDDVNVNVVKILSVISDIVIQSQTNVFIPNGLWVNPSISLPVYTAGNKSVTFSLGSRILTLPKPDMGNGDRFDFTRINRRSRGNTLIIYRDPTWPKTRTLNLTFTWLKESETYNLLSFLEETLGKEVHYIDHHEIEWKGFIMTPAAQLVQDSPTNLSLSLEFQGEKI